MSVAVKLPFFQRTPLSKVFYLKSLGNHTVVTAGHQVGTRGYKVWQSDTAVHDDRYIVYSTGHIDTQMQAVTVLDWETGRSVSLHQTVDSKVDRRHDMLTVREELVNKALTILTEL